MSASGNGFGGGGFPGAPGAVPGGAAPADPGAGFVLDIPPDPTWQPFETTDTLEMDGFYCAQITRESARIDPGKSSGVFLTLQILDEDARGKNLSKFMPDPRTGKSNTWFVWRGAIRSITGQVASAQAGFRYTPGSFQNQLIYIKTEPFMDDGVQRTSVAGFITKEEYDGHVAKKTHRWASRPKQQAAVPGGLPGGFPGAGFAVLPGAPGQGVPVLPAPGAPVAPQPMAAAPMAPPPAAPGVPQQGFGGFAPPMPAPVAPQPQAAPTMMTGFPAPPPRQQ